MILIMVVGTQWWENGLVHIIIGHTGHSGRHNPFLEHSSTIKQTNEPNLSEDEDPVSRASYGVLFTPIKTIYPASSVLVHMFKIQLPLWLRLIKFREGACDDRKRTPETIESYDMNSPQPEKSYQRKITVVKCQMHLDVKSWLTLQWPQNLNAWCKARSYGNLKDSEQIYYYITMKSGQKLCNLLWRTVPDINDADGALPPWMIQNISHNTT